MSQQRIAVLIALSIGALATFMPWLSIGDNYVPGSKGDGWISFVLYLGAILTLLAGGKKERILNTLNGNIIIFLSLCAALFGAWKIWDLSEERGTIEFGLYLAILSGFFTPIIAWFIGEKGESITDLFLFLIQVCVLSVFLCVLFFITTFMLRFKHPTAPIILNLIIFCILWYKRSVIKSKLKGVIIFSPLLILCIFFYASCDFYFSEFEYDRYGRNETIHIISPEKNEEPKINTQLSIQIGDFLKMQLKDEFESTAEHKKRLENFRDTFFILSNKCEYSGYSSSRFYNSGYSHSGFYYDPEYKKAHLHPNDPFTMYNFPSVYFINKDDRDLCSVEMESRIAKELKENGATIKITTKFTKESFNDGEIKGRIIKAALYNNAGNKVCECQVKN